jgi:hypothetical protein
MWRLGVIEKGVDHSEGMDDPTRPRLRPAADERRLALPRKGRDQPSTERRVRVIKALLAEGLRQGHHSFICGPRGHGNSLGVGHWPGPPPQLSCVAQVCPDHRRSRLDKDVLSELRAAWGRKEPVAGHGTHGGTGGPDTGAHGRRRRWHTRPYASGTPRRTCPGHTGYKSVAPEATDPSSFVVSFLC